MLDWIGPLVIAGQDGRFVGVHLKRLFVSDFLLRTEEASHSAPIVVSAQPCVACAEMACPQLRILLDCVDRTHQGFDFDAVNPCASCGLIRIHCFIHGDSSIDCVVTPQTVRLEHIIGSVKSFRKMCICQ